MAEDMPKKLTVDIMTDKFIPFILRKQGFTSTRLNRWSTREHRRVNRPIPDYKLDITVSETQFNHSRIARWLGERNMSWYAVHVTDEIEPSENRSYYINPDSIEVIRGDGTDENSPLEPMTDDEAYLLRTVLWRFFRGEHGGESPLADR